MTTPDLPTLDARSHNRVVRIGMPAAVAGPSAQAVEIVPEHVSLARAMKALGFTLHTGHVWCSKGDPRWFALDPVKLGGRWRVYVAKLQAFINAAPRGAGLARAEKRRTA